MQTSPVLNQANVLTNPAPSGRQSDGSASVTPFNQMLSREIADRRNAEAPKAPESRAPESKAAADNTQNTQSATSGAGTKATKSASEEKSTDDKSDASGTGDAAANATTQTPADMLALVASLNQANPATATADAKAVTEGDAAVATLAAKADRNAGLQAAAGRTEPADGKALKSDPNALKTSEKALADVAAKDLDAAAATAVEAAKAAKPDFAAEIKESITNASAAMQPVQQAALHAVQPALAHPQDKLTPAVGTPAWDQALGQKVVWMVAGEHQSASLTLNPPDLGPLQVVLNVNNSTASATFTAAQPEVRQALEAALPRLREMLGDAGIQLGQATVNSGSPNQQGTADQQASHGGRRSDLVDNRTETPMRVGRIQPAASGLGLVDTFV